MDSTSLTHLLWIKIFWVFVTWLKVEPSNRESQLKEMSELFILGGGQCDAEEGALAPAQSGLLSTSSQLINAVTWTGWHHIWVLQGGVYVCVRERHTQRVVLPPQNKKKNCASVTSVYDYVCEHTEKHTLFYNKVVITWGRVSLGEDIEVSLHLLNKQTMSVFKKKKKEFPR